jgi:hypothetical protein
MQTVTFRPNIDYVIKPIIENTSATLRNYKKVKFDRIAFLNDLTVFKISLLESAEVIEFVACKFPDMLVFKTVLDRCKKAMEINLTNMNERDFRKDGIKRLTIQQTNEAYRPVRCNLKDSDLRVLSAIQNISELNFKCDYRHENEALFVIENYASIIKSMHIGGLTGELILESLANNSTVKLRNLSLLVSGQNVAVIKQLFIKQQTNITSLGDIGILKREVCDVIAQHLPNLEKLECDLNRDASCIVNRLKPLKKLHTLVVGLYELEDKDFELDIRELSLTELKVTAYEHCRDLKIVNKSQKILSSMKKLKITAAFVQGDSLHKIINLMPNLEYLHISAWVSFYKMLLSTVIIFFLNYI